MKSEDRIVEFLSESLFKQDQMVDELKQINTRLDTLKKGQQRTNIILNQHDRDLMKIIELLEENYPKFDELVEIEHIDNSNRTVIRKAK